MIAVHAVMLAFSIVIVALLLAANELTPEATAIHNVQYYYTIGVFSAFFVTYLVVFIMLTSRLKQYYPKFYALEKHKVKVSSLTFIDIHFKFGHHDHNFR